MTDPIFEGIEKKLEKMFEDMMPSERVFLDEEARMGSYEKIEALIAIKELLRTVYLKGKEAERERCKEKVKYYFRNAMKNSLDELQKNEIIKLLEEV